MRDIKDNLLSTVEKEKKVTYDLTQTVSLFKGLLWIVRDKQSKTQQCPPKYEFTNSLANSKDNLG